MEKFYTIDVQGKKHEFFFKEDKHDNEITYRIYTSEQDFNEFYEHTFAKIDNDHLKSEMMTHYGNERFAKKGIPEMVIQIASKRNKRSVYSSPIKAHDGDFLTEASKKVWQRLQRSCKNVIEGQDSQCRECFIYQKIENII